MTEPTGSPSEDTAEQLVAAPSAGQVLLVEDDAVLREATGMALERYGFRVRTAADGMTGLERYRQQRPDVVLLDVMLPELDGVSVVRRIREDGPVPVLMISARTDPVDVVQGLEAGADDYLTKPYDIPVLVARIRAALRRARPAAGPAGAGPAGAGPATTGAVTDGGERAPGDPGRDGTTGVPGADRGGGVELRFGDLTVDPRALEVRRDGSLLDLTPTELKLLLEFAAEPGAVLSRDRLLEQVWEYAWGGDTRVVDVHVQRLRAKIGHDRIGTVRGFGYKLRR